MSNNVDITLLVSPTNSSFSHILNMQFYSYIYSSSFEDLNYVVFTNTSARIKYKLSQRFDLVYQYPFIIGIFFQVIYVTENSHKANKAKFCPHVFLQF